MGGDSENRTTESAGNAEIRKYRGMNFPFGFDIDAEEDCRNSCQLADNRDSVKDNFTYARQVQVRSGIMHNDECFVNGYNYAAKLRAARRNKYINLDLRK